MSEPAAVRDPAWRPRWQPNGTWLVVLVLAALWTIGRPHRVKLDEPPELRDGQHIQAIRRTSLRVGCCNIDQGRGPDGRVDLGRTARCLQGYDLLVLQDVRGAGWIDPDQLQSLGRSLAQASVFVPTVQQFWQDREGYGLLSRVPIEPREVIPLGSPDDDACGSVLLATVPLGGRQFQLLISCLDACGDLEQQTARLVDCFLEARAPALLLGDFELATDHPQFLRLLSVADVQLISPAATDPDETHQQEPSHHSWLVMRGLDTCDARIQPTPLARSPMLRAEVSLRADVKLR